MTNVNDMLSNSSGLYLEGWWGDDQVIPRTFAHWQMVEPFVYQAEIEATGFSGKVDRLCAFAGDNDIVPIVADTVSADATAWRGASVFLRVTWNQDY